MTAAERSAAGSIPYRLRWRPRGGHPGAHQAADAGSGGGFYRHVDLLRYPDPRRLDLRATLRHPTQEPQVRQVVARRSVTVVALVDLSGSTGFVGNGRRLDVAIELAERLAASAAALGDRFALYGCDEAVREPAVVAPTRRRAREEVGWRLRAVPPGGRSVRGLVAAAERLPRQRCLVFVLSDFLAPHGDLDDLMRGLVRHEVVPVILRDRAEETDLPRRGLVQVADLETGRRRLMLMRPSLAVAWHEATQRRRAALHELFARHGCHACEIVDEFDATAFADQLLGGGGRTS